ncbi:amidohydrolase family protein [Pseudaminobacter sp. NGMCC 1.201702]|uniref:amidohydrolase family protein n=1 Tax=Pseudaminobacter sp. NGMCC 1.201702 TaxID=3391825 RepID=UPI0039EE8911
MSDLLLTNVRPDAKAAGDILIENGRIAAIGPALRARAGTKVIDGGNAIAIAPFVEPHVHLDKILWGLPWHSINVPASLRAMIDNEVNIRKELPWSVAERAGNLMRQCVSMGSTHIRSHVDISTHYKLDNLHGVLEAWEKTKHAVDLELVAFPQTGMMIDPGTAELMEAALDEGASIIGGLDPANIDGDPKGHLDTIFDIASRKGAKIDIHLHEFGELGLFELGLIVDRAKALGMQNRVIVSHAFCLGDGPRERVRRMTDLMAEAGIGIISAVPGEIPFPPMFELAARGVRCAIASDSLRDTWNPHGNGDMLDRCWLLAYRTNCRTDEELIAALDMGTRRGAELLDLNDLGLRPGGEGSLVLIEGENLPQIVVDRPRRALVIKRGRVVARDGRWVDGDA